LLTNDGYAIGPNCTPFSSQSLAGCHVLVIVCAKGANDANDAPAFNEDETTAVEQWVRNGGALLLITDHFPFASAAQNLAQRFGVHMSKGVVEDPEHYEPSLEPTHLVFASETGLLRDHSITRGRNAGELIRRVLTFTGQSLHGPPGSTPLLALADT